MTPYCAMTPTAEILRAHQVTPRFQKDGPILWACKTKDCEWTAVAAEVRAADAEAAHQADILERSGVRAPAEVVR